MRHSPEPWELVPNTENGEEPYRVYVYADAMMEARKPRSATEAGIDGGRAEH